MALDRNLSESRREKERLKGRKELAEEKTDIVIVRECGQTWTKVRVKYYNY